MKKSKDKKRWFITVQWCGEDDRGILANKEGMPCVQDFQHTREQMNEQLGLIEAILSPQSEEFTEAEIKRYNKWIPLAEYQNEWGISIKDG